jgi:hypothetical protein
MILVGYQRSIRQICRSPYIETTISVPFVGMRGIAADRCHYWYWECRSLICENGSEILASAKPCEALRHNRTHASRSRTPAASISIFRGAEVLRTHEAVRGNDSAVFPHIVSFSAPKRSNLLFSTTKIRHVISRDCCSSARTHLVSLMA